MTNQGLPFHIKKFRKAKGLTQDELANSVGLKSLGKIETGVSNPSLEVLIKIADVLEVSLDELLGREVQNDESNHVSEVNKMMKETIKRMDRQNETYEHIIKKQSEEIDSLKTQLKKVKK